MPYLETPDGVPLFLVDEGPKTSAGIFLIHAEPFNSKFWQKNISVLARDFRVVAMDLRGRGESGKTDEGHNLAQFARDFHFLLGALRLQQVVVVGWSIGGSVIWRYLQEFGEDRLAGYVNVDQQPYRYVSEEDLQARLQAVRTRRLRYHQEVLRRYFGPEVEPEEELVTWMAHECMKTPTAAHLAAIEEAYRTDWRPFLSQVRLPTRVFWARYGNIVPAVAALMGDAMPNAGLVYFEHSGHLIPWTEAEKFNQELVAFARKVLP